MPDIDRNDYLSFVEFELLIVMEQVGCSIAIKRPDRTLRTRRLLRHAFEELDTDHDGRASPRRDLYEAGQFKQFDTIRT